MEEKAPPQSPPKQRKRRWARWLWIPLFILAMLAVIAFQPNLIRLPLQKWLDYKGIPVQISDIQSRLTTNQIAYTAIVSYQDNMTTLAPTELVIKSSWQRLLSEATKADIGFNKPKITIINQQETSSLELDKSIPLIIKQLFDFKSNQQRINDWLAKIDNSSLAKLGSWTINAIELDYNSQLIRGNVVGQSSDSAIIQFEIDKQPLVVNIDLKNKQIKAESEKVALQDLTALPIDIQSTKLHIDLADILRSTLLVTLEYQQKINAIQIIPTKENNGFTVSLSNEDIADHSLTMDVLAKDSTLELLFTQLKLSVLSELSSLLPLQIPYQSLAGEVNGQIIFDYQTNNFVESSITLDNLAFASEFAYFTNIDADIAIDAKKLAANIQLNNSEIQLPALFLSDKKAITGQGQVNYLFAENSIEFNDIKLHSADYQQVTVKGHLQFADKISLAISGTGEGLDVSKVKDYLPYPIMTEELIDWLTSAFQKGTANQLTFDIASLDVENLFFDDSLKFSVDMQVSDTDFLFIENNPIINVKSGKVSFQGKGLMVESDNAFIEDVPLKSKAVLADLTNPVLELDVKTEPRDIEKLLSVAEKSLVAEAINKTKAQLLLTGAAQIKLLLNYDFFAEKEDFALTVLARDADIALVAYPMLNISEANVDVLINQAGIQTIHANAKFNNSEATADISSQNGRLHGKVTSKQPVNELLQKFTFIDEKIRSYFIDKKIISGITDLQVEFTLDGDNNLTDIDVYSDLLGAKVNLFDAIKKDPTEKLQLEINYGLSNDTFLLKLGNQLNLLADLKKQSFLVANAPLSYQKIPNRYVDVDVKFSTVNIEQLIDFHTVFTGSSGNSIAVDKEQINKYSGVINLQLDNVNYQDIEIPNLSLSAVLNDNFRLVSGLFDISGQYTDDALFVNVDFIDIGQVTKLIKSSEIKKEYSGRKVEFSHSVLYQQLPSLTVNIKNIIFNGQTVATATLKSSKSAGKYSIDELYLNGNGFIFEVSAYEAEDMGSLVTKSQAIFRSDQVGKVLLEFGYEDVIDADSLDLSFNLTWPGGIERLDLENSYGKVALSSTDLRIREVKTGVGNLLGLIDIVSIVKSIMLDIDQVMNSELGFAQIIGNWNVGGGVAQTREFHANGSVIRLVASGGLDVRRQEYDFVKLLIIPKASNTLPIIGAVAGGLVGGIAALAIQQAFGDDIDRVVGIPYTLSGTWLDPKLNLGYQKSEKDKGPRDLFNDQGFGDK